MTTQKLANLLFIIIATIAFLILAKDILIPFIVAIVIWFIIKELREFFDIIPWIKNKLPRWLRSIIASVIVFGSLGITFTVLANNMNELKDSIPLYESNVDHAKQIINETFNIDLNILLSDYFVRFDFGNIAAMVLNSISNVLGSVFMVFIYILFLFIEESVSHNKLRYIYPDRNKYNKIKDLLEDIDKSIGNYIALKTLVSIITGIASYFVLYFIGIDSPFFWAFLIFLLNYIPVIGSLIGVLFPTVIALLQFAELTPALLVLFLGGSVQLIVGNIIEPKIMGRSLNVSSLVIILSLSIWGSIWGGFGMVISVPTTVIMIIIFSRFEKTKNIAILLSEEGKIDFD